MRRTSRLWRSSARILVVVQSRVLRFSGMPDRGPLLEGRDERVVRDVLGEADVADSLREAGDEPRRLEPPDRVDRARQVLGGPGDGSEHPLRHLWRPALERDAGAG